MVTEIIFRDEIKAQVLKVRSGYCFRERNHNFPYLYVLSPWISDVQLEIDADVYKLDPLWFGLDYGIESINLVYAILLLRLHFNARLDIVTLPPNEKNYGDSASFHGNILDFLDEIGCHIHLNQDLHTKLILSNDLALIGSFNLSKLALYDREEIGISIDDISNLKVLEEYARNVADSSVPYGYTIDPYRNHNTFPLTRKITRGWFYEQIVREYFKKKIHADPILYDEFLIDHIGTKSFYLVGVISELASDLEGFYVKAILKYFGQSHQANEKKIAYLEKTFNYQGEYKIENILAQINSKLARPYIPRIPLRLKTMPKTRDALGSLDEVTSP
jgi:hypothetical protein